MLFAHDTEAALAAATALVNTEGSGADELDDVPALDAFVERWGWTGSRTGGTAELDQVRSLRTRLRRLWHLDEDGVAQLVNDLLREARALPQLVRHGSWDYHLHASRPDDPLAERMAVEAAMGVLDLVRSQALDRLRLCAAVGCEGVLVDLSRNRSRRYCGATCSNRVNVSAFRARRAAEAT